MTGKKQISIDGYKDIHTGIVELLEKARHASARSVNAIMTATYWEIGRRIIELEQGGATRAEYGRSLIEQLANDLTTHFGRGFTKSNLWNMRAFYLAWPLEQILQTVSGELPQKEIPINTPNTTKQPVDLISFTGRFPLPWSAYIRLLSVKDTSARIFYETEAMRAGWSVRQLDRQISSLFYERTALSNNKVAMLVDWVSGIDGLLPKSV